MYNNYLQVIRVTSIESSILSHINNWLFKAINSYFLPGFLNAILGVPTDCIHQNVIRQCKLSFACWLQGGKHAKGCGGNKWLFSCCVVDNEIVHNNLNSLKKITTIPKRVMLKRRDENEIFQFVCCKILLMLRILWMSWELN